MEEDMDLRINQNRNRYPCCIVWTPIPILTWLFPFIGHMGIAYSSGIIRDFAGPYYVSEDNMAFGNPTKYLQFNPMNVIEDNWDQAISSASEEYKHRMHNLCCDNCHSHVAMALNLMAYNGKRSWNMINLACRMFIFGKYVSACGFLKSWLPFGIMLSIIITAATFLKYS